MFALIALMTLTTLVSAGDQYHCRLPDGRRRPRNFFGHVTFGDQCEICMCSTRGKGYCTKNGGHCRVCRSQRLMDCKAGCPSGEGWRHVSTHNHGCCASFWSCFGSQKMCRKAWPCSGQRPGRRMEDGEESVTDGEESVEEWEDEEGEEPGFILDESEYNEDELEQMTPEELNDFLEVLEALPHKQFQRTETPKQQPDIRRLFPSHN